jgi:hypothetical protein
MGVAERIEDALREPFPIDGHEATVTASIGIAVSTGREATPEDLIRNSDQAMYQAKRKGRARHELFAFATTSEDRSPVEVTEDVTEGVAELEAEISQGEAAIEDTIVIEPAEREAEPEPAEPELAEPELSEPERYSPDEPREAPESDDALGSAAALTEARRRRRLRFPPRG